MHFNGVQNWPKPHFACLCALFGSGSSCDSKMMAVAWQRDARKANEQPEVEHIPPRGWVAAEIGAQKPWCPQGARCGAEATVPAWEAALEEPAGGCSPCLR